MILSVYRITCVHKTIHFGIEFHRNESLMAFNNYLYQLLLKLNRHAVIVCLSWSMSFVDAATTPADNRPCYVEYFIWRKSTRVMKWKTYCKITSRDSSEINFTRSIRVCCVDYSFKFIIIFFLSFVRSRFTI